MPRIAIVDVETTPIKPGYIPRTKFWGWAIEGVGYRRYKTFASLAKDMLKQKPGAITNYFHHDYEITQMLVEGYTPHTMRARGSRIIRAQVAGQNWINSFALFPSSLAEILESAGYEKHPLNAPGHPDTCECAECNTALEKRNYSDTFEALTAFRAINDAYARASGVDCFGEGHATSASAAMQAAEAQAGTLPVDLSWREAYRGGRVEAFRIKRWDMAESWDINSSYPAAFVDAPKKDTLIHARVTVKASKVSPFFRHAPEDKKYGFLFPSGTYDTIFYESNYERYIQPHTHGIVRSIKAIQKIPVDLTWVTRVAPLMKRAYRLRAEAKQRGDKALVYALKIFMNSCYGRIGMKAEREICSIKDRIPEDCSHYDLPNGRHLVFTKHYLSGTKANYPVAGWITDNSRARLFAGAINSEPYYCDTDGIKCAPGSFKPSNNDGNALGGWKFEGVEPFYCRTVKDYVWGKKCSEHGKHKCKKCPADQFKPDVVRKGGKLITLEKDTLVGKGKKQRFYPKGTVVFGGTQWTVKKALPDKKGRKQGVKLVVKTRKTEYDKREIWPDGTTTPLIVQEEF